MLAVDEVEDQDGREKGKENRRPLGIGGRMADLGAQLK
jgi:hypothetical protein